MADNTAASLVLLTGLSWFEEQIMHRISLIHHYNLIILETTHTRYILFNFKN